MSRSTTVKGLWLSRVQCVKVYTTFAAQSTEALSFPKYCVLSPITFTIVPERSCRPGTPAPARVSHLFMHLELAGSITRDLFVPSVSQESVLHACSAFHVHDQPVVVQQRQRCPTITPIRSPRFHLPRPTLRRRHICSQATKPDARHSFMRPHLNPSLPPCKFTPFPRHLRALKPVRLHLPGDKQYDENFQSTNQDTHGLRYESTSFYTVR